VGPFLWVGLPGGLTLGGGGGVGFSIPVQTGPGAHPASYTMGTVFLSQG